MSPSGARHIRGTGRLQLCDSSSLAQCTDVAREPIGNRVVFGFHGSILPWWGFAIEPQTFQGVPYLYAVRGKRCAQR
jgi:hypothetical protein